MEFIEDQFKSEKGFLCNFLSLHHSYGGTLEVCCIEAVKPITREAKELGFILGSISNLEKKIDVNMGVYNSYYMTPTSTECYENFDDDKERLEEIELKKLLRLN